MDFLLELAQLNHLLETQQFATYWEQALALLHRWSGVQGLRLFWESEEQMELSRVLQAGEIGAPAATQILEWEATLQAAPLPFSHHSLEELAQRLVFRVVQADAQGAQTGCRLVHVPLLHEDVPYGALSLVCAAEERFQPGSPSAQQLVILADLLTDNYVRAHALATARRRLENVNLLYQFNQALTSLDLDKVLGDAAELVAYLLDAEVATIFLADAEKAQLTYMVVTGAAGHDLIGTQVSLFQGVAGWVIRHKQPLIVNAPDQDARFVGQPEPLPGITTRNILCAPLILQNRPIGAIQVTNRASGFRDQDLEWLTSVTVQIAISVENARLFSREQARVRELASLNQVSQTVTTELDVREVIRAITDSVLEILAVDRSELLLIDPQSQQLALYSATGAPVQSQWSQHRVAAGEGLLGWCVQAQEAVALDKVADDPRCAGLFASPEMAQASLAVVPFSSRGVSLGVILAYSFQGRPFDSDRMDLLQTFANQAAVALANATLYQDLKQEQERIITIQEGVRHQLARDLHDGPAQMLSSIILSTEMARRLLTRDDGKAVLAELDHLDEIARQANREVRTLLFELRPIILESRGLAAALNAYYRQLVGSLGSRVHLQIAPFAEGIAPRAANSIFAIIQESVNNIRKHAQAQNIWIRLYVEEQKLFFEVEDDGIGMHLGQLTANYVGRNSFGLLNMRERAVLLGGKLTVRSPRSPGQGGTVVVGVVPLHMILGEPDPGFSLF